MLTELPADTAPAQAILILILDMGCCQLQIAECANVNVDGYVVNSNVEIGEV